MTPEASTNLHGCTLYSGPRMSSLCTVGTLPHTASHIIWIDFHFLNMKNLVKFTYSIKRDSSIIERMKPNDCLIVPDIDEAQ